MALLTGDPRTATVVARDKTLVYEVTKSGLAPLMESTESLGQDLSEVLAERQMRTSNAVDDSRAYEDVKEEISCGLLSRIQNFFRLRISKPKVAAEADDAPDLAKSA
jgi:CRP-like cAMP-binding protein